MQADTDVRRIILHFCILQVLLVWTRVGHHAIRLGDIAIIVLCLRLVEAANALPSRLQSRRRHLDEGRRGVSAIGHIPTAEVSHSL